MAIIYKSPASYENKTNKQHNYITGYENLKYLNPKNMLPHKICDNLTDKQHSRATLTPKSHNLKRIAVQSVLFGAVSNSTATNIENMYFT